MIEVLYFVCIGQLIPGRHTVADLEAASADLAARLIPSQYRIDVFPPPVIIPTERDFQISHPLPLRTSIPLSPF